MVLVVQRVVERSVGFWCHRVRGGGGGGGGGGVGCEGCCFVEARGERTSLGLTGCTGRDRDGAVGEGFVGMRIRGLGGMAGDWCWWASQLLFGKVEVRSLKFDAKSRFTLSRANQTDQIKCGVAFNVAYATLQRKGIKLGPIAYRSCHHCCMQSCSYYISIWPHMSSRSNCIYQAKWLPMVQGLVHIHSMQALPAHHSNAHESVT